MPYDDIPTAGQHRGDESEHESGSNVRAQNPPEPGRYEGRVVSSHYRVARDKTRGLYRVRASTEEEMEALESDYEEVGQYTSEDELAEALDPLTEQHGFAVLENMETGEVYFDRESKLSDNWTGEGQYDQVTLFESEEEAARYAEKKQKEDGA